MQGQRALAILSGPRGHKILLGSHPLVTQDKGHRSSRQSRFMFLALINPGNISPTQKPLHCIADRRRH